MLVEDWFYHLLRATPIAGIIFFGCYLCELYQCQLYQEAFVLALSVVQVAVVAQFHCLVEELLLAFLCLSLVSFSD